MIIWQEILKSTKPPYIFSSKWTNLQISWAIVHTTQTYLVCRGDVQLRKQPYLTHRRKPETTKECNNSPLTCWSARPEIMICTGQMLQTWTNWREKSVNTPVRVTKQTFEIYELRQWSLMEERFIALLVYDCPSTEKQTWKLEQVCGEVTLCHPFTNKICWRYNRFCGYKILRTQIQRILSKWEHTIHQILSKKQLSLHNRNMKWTV